MTLILKKREERIRHSLCSQVVLNTPSILLTSMAFCSILVNLKGTFSGYLSRAMAT